MRSSNEITGMVLKAARGAGMPLGCAEELARAAPMLSKQGALQIVPDLLAGPFDPVVYEAGVISGGHPVLALTSWMDLIAAGQDVRLEILVVSELQTAMQAAEIPCGPFEVDASVWSALAGYAERTFVPETDASRLAGAGAGLTDND